VYPAAHFVAEARLAGAHTVELNVAAAENAAAFAEHRHGPATRIVPAWVDSLLSTSAP
jgi:NAD-dependent deacetylase